MGECIGLMCGGVVLWGYCALFVGFLDIVPAVSNRGVCLGTPIAFTAADRCWNCAILIGTGRYAV